MKALFRTTILSAFAVLALVALSAPVKAEVTWANPRTQQTETLTNRDFAQQYSAVAAEKNSTRQVAGNVSCGGYNAKVSSCFELTGMELFQRMGGPGDGNATTVNPASK